MKLSTILSAAATVCLLGSCSLLAPKGTTVSGANATKVSTTKTTKNGTTVSNKTDSHTDKAIQSIEKGKETNIPDKQVGHSTAESTVATNNTSAPKSDSRIAETLSGEWMIVSVKGNTLQTVDDMPYINFEKGTGRFYASNGCNILNGSYNVTPAGSLTFDNVLSTMKMCPDTQYESEISSILSGVSPYNIKIDKLGHESYLKIYNTSGTELMTARKHNMDFLNGNWLITSVNGKAIDDEEANVFIDINEMKIHGNTGCNFFNGQIYINPEKSNSIDFSNMALTRMACPKMEQESAIMLALEETTTAIEGNPGQAMLLGQSGKELITLKKTQMPSDE